MRKYKLKKMKNIIYIKLYWVIHLWNKIIKKDILSSKNVYNSK